MLALVADYRFFSHQGSNLGAAVNTMVEYISYVDRKYDILLLLLVDDWESVCVCVFSVALLMTSLVVAFLVVCRFLHWHLTNTHTHARTHARTHAHTYTHTHTHHLAPV